MKLKKLAHLIALIGVVGPAVAQEAQPQQSMQRVEITGSSIKRIVAEGAMPVQLISREDIARSDDPRGRAYTLGVNYKFM